jgi:enoyl-CoA hydratase/carnithine racemase
MTPESGISLEVSRASGRADLRIAIPPVNVLDLGSLSELARAIREAAGARVLVLQGLPRAFSAGVSVADHVPEPSRMERMLGAMRAVLAVLVEAPAVTVARVSGACLGGGAEIAAACDRVLASEDARIGFPEIRLACVPPGAAALLPLRVGEARAAEWILSGRVFSGRTAAEAGFASRAVPAVLLDAELERVVGELLAMSPASLSAACQLLRRARREALARDLPAAEEAYLRLAGSDELARAVSEFFSRRGGEAGR